MNLIITLLRRKKYQLLYQTKSQSKIYIRRKIFYNRETIAFIGISPFAKRPPILSWLADILELKKVYHLSGIEWQLFLHYKFFFCINFLLFDLDYDGQPVSQQEPRGQVYTKSIKTTKFIRFVLHQMFQAYQYLILFKFNNKYMSLIWQ